MAERVHDFSSLPPEFQNVLRLAQDTHNIAVTPLQDLKGGRTGAHLYLASVSSPASARVQHLVLKLDHKSTKTKMDELERHRAALSQAPPEFARQHIAHLAFERVELDGAVAIFYTIAGQSLHHYRSLASYQRQARLEALFSTTNEVLLAEWNAALTFEQAVLPQELLANWLGYRLQPGGNIEHFLEDVCHIHQDTAGLLIQGQVFPNPLVYARDRERWGAIRPIDTISGFQHGDLNIGNILARFTGNEAQLTGYYLIDFALFKANMPLLYDQCYLEMSYLIRELSRAPSPKWVDFVTRLAEQDFVDPRQVPIELAGTCAVIAAGRRAFDDWVQASYPSLSDDLWGQFWLAAVAVGMNYCNKAAIPEQERLAGLIFAAAHLKRYHAAFGVSLPVEVKHLGLATQPGESPRLGTLARFPPARPEHNLPAQPTPFIGRQVEVQAGKDLLMRENVHLLTMTGPGGTGKTRLALQVGADLTDRFADGVSFVDLAPIDRPELVATTIAHSLGIREGGGRPPAENLKEYLADKAMLLILDNFEQIIDAAPVVADLLASAPMVKVLATSRVALKLLAEHEVPIAPLELPQDEATRSIEEILEYDAAKLFVHRAKTIQPGFELTRENASAVVEICRRLDGLPLAIEIAAARIKLLPPQAILKRLNKSLQLLVGGAVDAPARHQTLRSAVNWSYNLLKPDEQSLFACLSVFVGGFSLESAESVCSLSGIADVFSGVEALFNASLLRRVGSVSGEPRFDMLQTIREYAFEKLEAAGRLAELRRAHAAHYAGLSKELGFRIFPREAANGLLRIEEEHDNFRAALSWGLESENDLSLVLQICISIFWFWYRCGHFHEGRNWSERAMAGTQRMSTSSLHATALFVAALMTMWEGDLDIAAERAESAIRIVEKSGDETLLSNVSMAHGIILINQGLYREAHSQLVQAAELFDEMGNRALQAITLVHLSNAALGLGEFAEANARLDQAMPFIAEIGDRWQIAFCLNNYGEVARAQGDYEKARGYYARTEAAYLEADALGDHARLIHTFGYLALRQNEYVRAWGLFQESLAKFRVLGNRRGIAECLAGLASVAAEQDQSAWAVPLLGAADALLTSAGGAWWPADRVEFVRTVERLESSMDKIDFETRWAEGRAMGMEAAISYAIEAAGRFAGEMKASEVVAALPRRPDRDT